MAYVVFFLVALIATGAALGLVLRTNAIHGALFLVLNLGSIAALYLMLGAEFLAAAQVIVYAGAGMVLDVFVVGYVGGMEAGLAGRSGPGLRALQDRRALSLSLALQSCIARLALTSAVSGRRSRASCAGPSASSRRCSSSSPARDTASTSSRRAGWAWRLITRRRLGLPPSFRHSSTLPCTGKRMNERRLSMCQWILARFHGRAFRSYQSHLRYQSWMSFAAGTPRSITSRADA